MSRQPLPDRKGGPSSDRAGSLGIIAADAIIEKGVRLSDLEPHLKERLRQLLPDYVCGINPLAALSQDAETAAKTIEIGVDSDDVDALKATTKASPSWHGWRRRRSSQLGTGGP